MLKKLYGEWLEERRKSGRPPLPSDAHIYMAAFIEWSEKRLTQRALDTLHCEEEGCNEPAVMFYCETHAP